MTEKEKQLTRALDEMQRMFDTAVFERRQFEREADQYKELFFLMHEHCEKLSAHLEKRHSKVKYD